MSGAKNGDTVKVVYTGKLDDGSVFDTTAEGEPIEFTIGQGQVLPAFEEAVIGMGSGDSKTIVIPPDEAYGDRSDELILTMGRDQVPFDREPEIGKMYRLVQKDGQSFPVTVMDMSEETIVFDANHPLAGKDLTFDIQLVQIL